MPYDRLNVRINGAVSPLGTGGWVELTDLSVGYYGITKCTLVDNRIKHEATSLAYPNDLIEISRDDFTTILWKGRVSRYTPGGVANEGVTLECSPLEDILKRRTCRWNLNPEMQYNQGFMTDVSSPAFDGTVSVNHRWTLGEILIDVLEHAWGINTASRLTSGGGFANMPLVSDIPLHHPDPLSVTHPYVSAVTPGPARDYLDQLVWDPTVIKALLDFRIPDIHFRDMDLWSVIEQIVQNAGEHGVFIDPTDLYTPRLVVHKFSNSTLVQVRVGQRGVHVETPSIRVKQDDWVFDDENVKNLIVIQGTGTKGTTDPTLAAADPLSGKMDKVDSTGKVWRVRNQDIAYLLGGYNANFRNLSNSEKKEPLPQLYVNGSPYTAQVAGWLPNGVLLLQTAISGDVRVKTMYSKPFQVTVGPTAASNTQYPIAGPFDAYGQFGIVKEMHISEPQFTMLRNIEQEFPFIGTVPKSPDLPDGKLVVAAVQRRKLDELGYPQLFQSTERDDTTTMRRYAEEYQRRFRDISIKLTLTMDGILLEDLWRNSGIEVGLRKRVSLIGLEGNRWSDAELQVTSIRANIPKNELVVECSSTVYNVTKLFPAVWKRRHEKRKQEEHQNDLEALLHGDTLSDQGSPAPDGEPQMQGIRQLHTSSPAPRFVRYPGFRKHIVRVTEIPGGPLGVYHGTRIDEFYMDDPDWDKIVKFFYLAEAVDPPTGPLLKVDDVVTIMPVYRDSLQIFLRKVSRSSILEVEQDEAHVAETISSVSTFKAIIWDKKEFIIQEHGGGLPEYSSDPAFDDLLLIGCPPAFPPRKRGEYSWVEATEFIAGNPALSIGDRDFGQAGVWVPKPGGRFGVAGQCDAALEVNRSNANIHKSLMIVEMYEGITVTCSSSFATDFTPANEFVSSMFDIEGIHTSNVSTSKRYWFNVAVPRSDCGTPYFVTVAPDNDTP